MLIRIYAIRHYVDYVDIDEIIVANILEGIDAYIKHFMYCKGGQ